MTNCKHNCLSLEPLEVIALRSGFAPAELRVAYGFAHAFQVYGAAARGAGVTIAVVDAYNDPTLAGDLSAYSSHFGLATPELAVVNLGPPGNTGGETGWSIEEVLDVETIHALLPRARIVLVEAASASLIDLATAEMYAAGIPGAAAISNSWGSADDPYDGPNNVPFASAFGADSGIVYAAAAGDASGPLSYPAALPNVVAVGGTTLTHNAQGYHQRPWLSYFAGYTDPAKTRPDARLVGGYPGLEVYGTSGFGAPTWTDVWGTSLACPAFVAMVGVADGVRLGRGLTPLGTSEVLAGLTPDETPTAPGFVVQFG
jgi:subtilase family serine protease